MVCNFTGMVRTLIDFEVSLSRKRTAPQTAPRKRLEFVKATNPAHARQIAMAMPVNAEFRISKVKEIR